MRVWPRERDTQLAVGLVVVALLPFVVLLVRLIGRSHPALNGDDALINLRVHDVFTAHTPLLGSYERYGFNQPGPAWFYVLAVPFRVLGSRFSAIQIGVLVTHAVSTVLVARVLWRRFGAVALAWGVLVMTALFWGLGPLNMTDPWEPHVTSVLLVTVAVLAFDAIYGELVAWILLVAIASLATQMYGTAGVIACALVVWGLVIGAVRLVRAGEWPSCRRRLSIAVGAGVALWVPPIVQEVRDHPGNLTATWRFIRARHVTIGLRDAIGALRLETGFPAVWLGRSVPLQPFTAAVDPHHAPWLPASMIVLLAVAVVAWRARATPQLWFAATVGFAVLMTVITLSRLSTPFFTWLIEPTRAAGALLWLPLGTLPVLLSSARARAVIYGVVAAAVVVLAIALVVRSARDDIGPPPQVTAFARLATASKAALREGRGPVIVTSEVHNQVLQASGFGHDELSVDLALDGFDVVSGSKPNDLDAVTRFGAFRAHPERATRKLVLQLDGSPPPPGGRVIAHADPLDPHTRATQSRLLRDIAGVCGTGDLHKLKRCRTQHPQVARWLDQLQAIPNLPALQLVLLAP